MKAVIHPPRRSCDIVPVTGTVDLGHVKNLISRAEHSFIVREDEQSLVFLLTNGQKCRQHLPRCAGIKAGAWLIRQDQGRIIRQGARDCDPLLLAPRQVLRLVGETHTQTQPGEEFTSVLTLLALRDGMCETS